MDKEQPYVVSYLKYRPQKFEDVVGQSHITDTLQNAIKRNHLPQAILFCGSRGTGKTTCARILAKEINKQGLEQEDVDFSFNVFELDAASNNSVEDIRNLIEQVQFLPQKGKYKVYIIDEAHMLSASAFNAFLKTLEEPPKHAIFILATTEKHKIIPTILSRCQIFDFKKISDRDITDHLKKIAQRESILYEEGALRQIAKKAEGGLRDALSIFDRISILSENNITLEKTNQNLNILDYDYYFKIIECSINEDIKGALLIFDEVIERGFDGRIFISGLASHIRDLMVAKAPETTKLMEVNYQAKNEYVEQSKLVDRDFIISSLSICEQAELNYRNYNNQRLLIEIALMKICSIKNEHKKKTVSDSIHSNYSGEKKQISINSSADTLQQKIDVGLQENYREQKKNLKNSSINDIIYNDDQRDIDKTKQNVKKEQNLESVEKRDISMDMVDEFIEKIRDSKRGLFTVLSDSKIELQGNTINIKTQSNIAKSEVEDNKNYFMNFLKEKTNQKNILINITIDEVLQKKEIIYTPQDKWNYLVKKNDMIIKLRTDYGYDF